MYQRKYEEKGGFYADAGVDATKLPSATAAAWPNPNALKCPTKMSCLISPVPSDDELNLVVQMGATHVFTWVSNEQSSEEFLRELRSAVEAKGLCLWNVGNRALGKNRRVILERSDEDIAAFCQFVRTLGKAGIGVTTFTWEADGVWNTHTEPTRGGIPARGCDATALASVPPKGRPYEEEELWGNMQYFLDAVLPVCESAGVRLALHPNDPPVDAIAGVPCLIRNRAAYDRVFKMARGNPMLGMEFCCGCWLEGGEDGFGNLYSALTDFISRGRVFIVHLRNVTSPLPRFVETYIDGGYGDMYQIIRT